MLGSRGTRALLVASVIAVLAAPLAFAQADAVRIGTPGDDVIVGSAASESIYGLAGNDTIDGGAGDDELDGGPGADVIKGGPGSDAVSYSGSAPISVTLNRLPDDGAPGEGDNVADDVEDIFGADGNDHLTGDAAPNTMDGGAGDDTIDGGAGDDTLYGSDGSDTIISRDGGPDHVDCGPGNDSAIVDAADTVVGCEHLALPPITPEMRLSKLFPVDGTHIGSFILAGVLKGSTVVVVCRTGCRPAGSTEDALLRVRRVHPRHGGVKLKLGGGPQLVGGTMFEIGVTAPRARTRCDVFQLSKPLARVRPLSTRCTTAAREG